MHALERQGLMLLHAWKEKENALKKGNKFLELQGPILSHGTVISILFTRIF